MFVTAPWLHGAKGNVARCSEFLGTEERWHWLLGFNGFTALLQLSTLPFLPESPRFLLLDRGDRQACEKGVSPSLCVAATLICCVVTLLCSS